MKYLIFPLVALGMGTAAMAQAPSTPPSPPSPPSSYPPCSKTVTDECTSSSGEMMHHAARPAAHHKAAHHKAAAHHKVAARHHRTAHAAKPAAEGTPAPIPS